MKLFDRLPLSCVLAPTGAVLHVERLTRRRAQDLARECKIERVPGYRPDRIGEALELPPPETVGLEPGEQALVAESWGYNDTRFFLITFVCDLNGEVPDWDGQSPMREGERRPLPGERCKLCEEPVYQSTSGVLCERCGGGVPTITIDPFEEP